MLAHRQLQSSRLPDPYSITVTSIPVSNSVYDLTRAHPPRGLKGFFSRSKSDHSGPAVIHKSTIKPLAEPSTSRAPVPSATVVRNQQSTSLSGVSACRKQSGTGDRVQDRPRPSSPDQISRNIRFNPSVHPAIQKGKDGRWQPPSLSRGSMSTSALELYAQEEVIARSVTPASEIPMTKPKKGHKHTFSVLINPNRFTPRHTSAEKTMSEKDFAPRSPRESQNEENIRANIPFDTAPPAGSAASWDPSSPSHSPASPTAAIDPTRNSPTSSQVASRRSSLEVLHEELETSSRNPPASPRRYTPTSPARSQYQYIRSRASASSSLTLPTYTESYADALTSREHDLLHLSNSILIRYLATTDSTPALVQNGKDAILRRLADERLSALSRMERACDSERAIPNVGEQPKVPGVIAARSFEAKIRPAPMNEETKERERKLWIGALQDGILLCL